MIRLGWDKMSVRTRLVGPTAVVMIGMVALSGCTSGTPTSSTTPAGTTATTSHAATVPTGAGPVGTNVANLANVAEPCTALSTATVAQLAKLTTTPVKTAVNDDATSKGCKYNERESTSADILITPLDKRAFDAVRNSLDGIGSGKTVSVDGLGDEAYHVPGDIADSVTVYRNGLSFAVTIASLSGTSTVPQCVDLARYVLSKY
jgi:hypothetical protein